jgi:putative ABC transport system permease protein
MLLDLLYAYRLLRKSPIATAVTILALALGIGANIGSFIAVNALVLHPFPYPNLDRIMTVWGTLPKAELNRAGVTAADFEDWKRQSRSFEALAAYTAGNVNLTGADRPEPVQEARVGAGFFQVFGMKPNMGRTFSNGDDESHNPQVAVLSNALWRGRFAASREVIGKTIPLGGQSYTIIGVMPDDFDYPLATDVWVPLVLTPAERSERVYHTFLAVGRLKPGVNAVEAQAELRANRVCAGAAVSEDECRLERRRGAAASNNGACHEPLCRSSVRSIAVSIASCGSERRQYSACAGHESPQNNCHRSVAGCKPP